MAALKKQFLSWASAYTEVVVLDSNSEFNSVDNYSNYDFIVAVDSFTSIKTDAENGFQDLHQYQSQAKDWIFGYLSYDLKNDTENLTSTNFDGLEFPDLFFFQPKKLFLLRGNKLEIQYLSMCDDEIDADYNNVISIMNNDFDLPKNELAIQQRISNEQYINKVNTILNYIKLGTIYEANFCMEYFAEQASIDPVRVYQNLQSITQTPFSCFFKNRTNYLLCASPERYLKKQNAQIISQPIKGTAQRLENTIDDEIEKLQLVLNAKERAENIMIVDLVRNDLSKTATKGSVKVAELCKAHTFKQVHQLISTVTSEVDQSVAPVAVLQTTFPMGSMTGAPKIAAMQLIEDVEVTKRGLYSGSVGYFMPNGDFDFNVVIRSILYNSALKYVSFSVGSAITAEAIATNEYQECLLKAKAMFEVLN